MQQTAGCHILALLWRPGNEVHRHCGPVYMKAVHDITDTYLSPAFAGCAAAPFQDRPTFLVTPPFITNSFHQLQRRPAGMRNDLVLRIIKLRLRFVFRL